MIKGILFDLGFTLEKPESGDWMLTKKFYSYYPKEKIDALPKEELFNAISYASIPLRAHHKISTLKEEEELFTQFYLDMISKLPQFEITKEIAKDISKDRTYDYEKYVLYDSTKETLKKLKAKGYRLGVLSDTWPSTVPQLEEDDIAQYFDCFTYSFQLGVFKPDVQLFEDAKQKMGLQPNEILFVDDLARILHGAKEFGFYVVQSCQNPRSEKDETLISLYQPSDIFEILENNNFESETV